MFLFQGTELQKYLNGVGYSEFEAFEQNNVNKLTNCPNKVSLKKTIIQFLTSQGLLIKNKLVFILIQRMNNL